MTLKSFAKIIIVLWLMIPFCSTLTKAQEKPTPPATEAAASQAAELAKKLSNPIASLISVPFQNNSDYGIGQYNGSRNTLNFQPVVPIKLSSKLILITRMVLPIITQNNITGEGAHQFGLGDAVVSGFFSPTGTKVVWGVGPALSIPTATNSFLGSKKLGVGPTAVVLKQSNGFTYGALVNQIWSVAGDQNTGDINQMFLQPFFTYNWKSGAGLGGNMEMTQNWEASTTTAFINPIISGVTKLGKQIVSIAFGPRIPVAAPSASKTDFGWRGVLIFVFPK